MVAGSAVISPYMTDAYIVIDPEGIKAVWDDGESAILVSSAAFDAVNGYQVAPYAIVEMLMQIKQLRNEILTLRSELNG